MFKRVTNHTLKLLERIIDKRIRGEIELGKEQMGFMEGRETIDGILRLRQL